MTLLDKEIILKTDSKTLAKWWCKLNRWQWPEAFPDPEPEAILYKQTYRRRKLMLLIIKIVGTKVIVREWNRAMTDDQFDAFWKIQGAEV